MVQTEKQYQFLYKAVNEYISLIKTQQSNKNKQQSSVYLSLADDTTVSAGGSFNQTLPNNSNPKFDPRTQNFHHSFPISSNDGITLPTHKSNPKFFLSDSPNNSIAVNNNTATNNTNTLPSKNSQRSTIVDQPDDGYLVPSDHLLNSSLTPPYNQAIPVVRRGPVPQK